MDYTLYSLQTYTYGKLLSSPQVSITSDLLQRNVVAYYIYGSHESATLLELTLGKSNAEFMAEAEVNFEKLVKKLFRSVCQSQLPDYWECEPNTTFEHSGYIVKCEQDEVLAPHTLKVLIAACSDLDAGLQIRSRFLQ
ncbi:hypothetical protein VST7929_02932 [Vibrio stylophorae]|uniref:Uncharacterized protein n=1 Tax=Vibrio stylophorae TaxID=659351 RepID=A0ABM8ZXA8_9VIBR|nr:hypothetical protein [Vibrio stylophorae]CAH0535334.1 hypothetical protein VST7929_02932 [Vibrio stylophorae]